MTNTICFCNYSIGANAYEEVGATCKFCGKKILLIGGEKALAAGKARLEAAIAGSGSVHWTGGAQQYRLSSAPCG